MFTLVQLPEERSMFLRMTKAFVRSGTMLLKVWNVFGIEQVSFEGRE